MKIVNAVGAHLPALVISLGKQQAATLQHVIKLRPFKKVITYTTDTSQDIYIIIIQLFQNPVLDRIVFVNGNEFRLASAIDETLGDGSVYPTVAWVGGVPPFIIQLIYQSVDGNTQIFDVSGMAVNFNTNLTDGTGDIVPASAAREYIIERSVDSEGWWADDLETEDLGVDETVNLQRRQNSIGLQITDSSAPQRSIFIPFAPDPTYEADGVTPSGLFAKYPAGRFGPLTWCVPPVDWSQPAGIVYGAALRLEYELSAKARVPGTSTELAGTYVYGLDQECTERAEGIIPGANTSLTLYVRFSATDAAHYHTATAQQTIVVSKAAQEIGLATINWQDGPLPGSNANYICPGDYCIITIRRAVKGTSGQAIIATTSTPDQLTIVGITQETDVNETFHETQFKIVAAALGAFTISFYMPGNENYFQSNTESYSATIQKPAQTITITVPAIAVGQTVTISAVSDSGLPVTLSLNNDYYHRADLVGDQLTALKAGSLQIMATQAGNSTYDSATSVLDIEIAKGQPVITWLPQPLVDITYGTTFASSMTATANVAGSIAYILQNLSGGEFVDDHQIFADTVLAHNPTDLWVAGWVVEAVFTPTDTDNYNSESLLNSIVVNEATPVISWSPAASIYYSTSSALYDALLNATAVSPITGQVVAGTFTYDPPAGTVLAVGEHSVTVEFTPTDTNNYNTPSGVEKWLTVAKASQTIEGFAVGSTSLFIDGYTAATSVATSGLTVIYSSSNTAVCTVDGSTITAVGYGSCVIYASQPGNSEYNAAATQSLTINVSKLIPSVTWGYTDPVAWGDPVHYTCSANVPGTFSFTPAEGTVMTTPGEHYCIGAFLPTDSARYEGESFSARFTVSAQTFAYTVLGNNQVRISGGYPYSDGYNQNFRYANGTTTSDYSILNTTCSAGVWDGEGYVYTISQTSGSAYWCRKANTGLYFTDYNGTALYVPFQTGFTPPGPYWQVWASQLTTYSTSFMTADDDIDGVLYRYYIQINPSNPYGGITYWNIPGTSIGITADYINSNTDASASSSNTYYIYRIDIYRCY